jgi:hypothetical protein
VVVPCRGEQLGTHPQEATRDLHVYDGWLYFVHGWTQAVGRVFNLNLSAEVVADLERLVAETVR